jgi:glycerol dehydrogenase
MEGKPRAVVEEVLQFSTLVGLPVTLAEIGLAERARAMLENIALRATAEQETIHNEPFEVRPDMVTDAILTADSIGQAWRKARTQA